MAWTGKRPRGADPTRPGKAGRLLRSWLISAQLEQLSRTVDQLRWMAIADARLAVPSPRQVGRGGERQLSAALRAGRFPTTTEPSALAWSLAREPIPCTQNAPFAWNDRTPHEGHRPSSESTFAHTASNAPHLQCRVGGWRGGIVRMLRFQPPPHRTVRAVLPHTAHRRRSPPAFGLPRQSLKGLGATTFP